MANGVRDVEASSVWYQAVLKCRSAHGGPEYERLECDGLLVLQLHAWDTHEHPHLGSPESKPYGNGFVLWFQTNCFDEALHRIRGHGAHVIEGPQVNLNAQHREIWLRDLDGYIVVIAGAYGVLGLPGHDATNQCDRKCCAAAPRLTVDDLEADSRMSR